MRKLKSFFQGNTHAKQWVGILALLALSVGSLQLQYSDFLMGSVLQKPAYTFDGAVSPIEEMLDYSKLKSGDRELTYSELKASGSNKVIPHLLHLYKQSNLTFDLETINWKSSSDIEKMNLQYNITVPYAGNYKMDSCGIGCGSHPGIDWVTPIGTPIRSAVAGEVIKTSEQSSGFGHHIVVKTEGAPHPSNANQTTTIYFAYSHLSDIYVNQGDIVEAGEIIALSGETGTATAPHLDWQLALENVPWTPYWPFTWTEASNAGYDFWSAVNAGLGSDNMYTYMADPAEYVNRYTKESYVAPTAPTVSPTTPTVEVDSEVVEDLIEDVQSGEEIIDEEAPVSTPVTSVVTMDIATLDVDMPSFLMAGDAREIEITLYDATGAILKNPQFSESIEISFSTEDVAKVNRSFLDKNDFSNGVAALDLHGDQVGQTSLVFSVGTSTFTSTTLNVIDEIQPFAKFGVGTDAYYVPYVNETIQIQAQDLSGDPTPKITGEGTVALKVIEGDATLTPSQIHTDDFTNGIAEVTLYSESNEDIVIQVTYGTKVTESVSIQVQDFTDLSTAHDYYPAVSFLRSKGTITGYPDGSFQPDRDVSRIEALKMIFSGLDLNVASGSRVSFVDTASTGEWYSDYLATAASMGVVQGYPDGSFKPTQGVNRVEFLKMLFASMDISVDPVVLDDPALDVDNLAWHAPYVQYAMDKNIFPDANSSKNFYPGEAMTRVEVAEVIYRFLVVTSNADAPYSVKLAAPSI